MKWRALRAVAVLGLSGALVTGCGDSGGASRAEHASASATASPSSGSVSTKARFAEHVKLALEKRLSADEQQFGSGTDSPCATSSAEMFTAKCTAAAEATAAAARLALSETHGRQGFATLDSVARKLQAAVLTYDTLDCATGPTATDTRKACLKPAAVIAQGFEDLRGGANLGLAGK